FPMLSGRSRIDILKSHRRLLSLSRHFALDLIFRAALRPSRAAFLGWEQMLGATNRSGDIVRDVLVLFPLRRIGFADVIGENVVTRLPKLNSLIKSKTAHRPAMQIGSPVSQSVVRHWLALVIEHKAGIARRLHHCFNGFFRSAGTVVVPAIHLCSRHGDYSV